MADNPRIEDLKRRVQKDPASIAFAQLAEEYRRAGQCEQAVDVCHAGLAVHPGYLSARVTLGRALVDLGRIDEAQHELEIVLKGAPENLAALRGLAEIHQRRGALADSLTYYRSALALARNDPDLEQTVADLTGKVAPPRQAAPHDGLSLEQMQRELAAHATPPIPPALPEPPPAPQAVQSTPVTGTAAEDEVTRVLEDSTPPPAAADPERDRALHTIAALEDWLASVHAARADRQP